MSTLTKEQAAAANELLHYHHGLRLTDTQWNELADILQRPYILVLLRVDRLNFVTEITIAPILPVQDEPNPGLLEEAVRRGLQAYALSVGAAGWKDSEAVQRIAAEVRKLKDGAK